MVGVGSRPTTRQPVASRCNDRDKWAIRIHPDAGASCSGRVVLPVIGPGGLWRGGTIDLYGNEVTNAVAEYTVDPGGSLYELHSPQTELPRLGSPKS